MFAKSFAECRDMAREIVFFDDCIGPDQLEQSVLLDNLAAPLDQDEQNLERFERQYNRNAIATKTARHRIGDDRAECIKPVVGTGCEGVRSCDLIARALCRSTNTNVARAGTASS